MEIKTVVEQRIKLALLLDEAIMWYSAHTEFIKDVILDLITDNQLMDKGVDADGEIIGRYSKATEMISGGRKKAGDPYNLNDTGSFFRSMFINVLENSIEIDASSQTFTEMQDQNWWRISILGMTEQSLNQYVELLKENYIIFTRETLGID
jgi:hypothetical protein